VYGVQARAVAVVTASFVIVSLPRSRIYTNFLERVGYVYELVDCIAYFISGDSSLYLDCLGVEG
jgi:hypothetical protein